MPHLISQKNMRQPILAKGGNNLNKNNETSLMV